MGGEVAPRFGMGNGWNGYAKRGMGNGSTASVRLGMGYGCSVCGEGLDREGCALRGMY